MNYLKVISFSLWGNNLNYTTGAIENAKLAKYYILILNVGFMFILTLFLII